MDNLCSNRVSLRKQQKVCDASLASDVQDFSCVNSVIRVFYQPWPFYIEQLKSAFYSAFHLIQRDVQSKWQ